MDLISSDEVKRPYFLYMVIIVLLVVFVLLYLSNLFTPNSTNLILILLIYQMIAILILYILVTYSYLCGYWYRINKVYTKNLKSEYNYTEGGTYTGVVIANKGFRFYKYSAIYNGAILLLIESLRNENKPLKIVKEANREDVTRLILDDKCKELFIIGHGSRDFLRLSRKEKLYYNEFKDRGITKDRVEQLHCNHSYVFPYSLFHKDIKPSLAEILNAEEKYKSYKKRDCEELIGYFLKELVKK